MNSIVNIGVDAGSTTVKVVVTDEKHTILFKEYRRHLADVAGLFLLS